MAAEHRTLGRLAAVGSSLCLVLAIVIAVPSVPSAAQSEAGPVTSDKEGWWNRLAGVEEEEPAPANPLGASPAPPPPSSVPEGAIAVGAVLGEPDKVAAVGVVLPVEQGGTVARLVMTLGLVEDEAAQGGTPESGAIRACAVTGFWVPEENGKFQNRPEADCEIASAPGTRNEDGSWTFDLTAIASLWVDPAATIFPNGVLLEPVVEPPESFQVSFAGGPDGIAFDFAGEPGDDADDPFGLGGGGGGFDGGGFGDSGNGGGSFGGGASGGSSGGSFDAGSPPAFTAPDTPPPVVEAPDAGTAAPPTNTGGGGVAPAAPVGTQIGNTLGNFPAGAWVVLLLGLALAFLAALTLGPAGAAEAAPRRAGGVSRVLSQRTAQSTT